MTNRGEISLRDIAHKITFFQSLACFIFPQHLLLRTLDFCDVFVWKWGPRPRTSSRWYHHDKNAATFKKEIFVHYPWVPNCMKNLKGGLKIFISQDVWFLQRLVLNTIQKCKISSTFKNWNIAIQHHLYVNIVTVNMQL